jgi:hypothetical protein
MSAASLDREKLVRVLGMLGSAHDGEIAAAGRAADRLIREAGLRWPDVIVPRLSGPTRERDPETFGDALDYALQFAEHLSDWERSFLWSLRRQRSPISTKQAKILHQIIEKVRRAERATA